MRPPARTKAPRSADIDTENGIAAHQDPRPANTALGCRPVAFDVCDRDGRVDPLACTFVWESQQLAECGQPNTTYRGGGKGLVVLPVLTPPFPTTPPPPFAGPSTCALCLPATPGVSRMLILRAAAGHAGAGAFDGTIRSHTDKTGNCRREVAEHHPNQRCRVMRDRAP